MIALAVIELAIRLGLVAVAGRMLLRALDTPGGKNSAAFRMAIVVLVATLIRL